MTFNIITLTDAELKKLNVAQMRLLRAAQQKKNELIRKADKDFKEFRKTVLAGGMKNSTLLEDKRGEIDAEVNYQCSVIADNLIYEMSIAGTPMGGGSTGSGSTGGGSTGGNSDTGYLVDYSLSYSERYAIVRDYYLAISDVNERMTRYAADTVAKDYLGSYYGALYNLLATYEK